MCDSFVALPHHTESGHLIFGKNSDREPNEAQSIVHIPAKFHSEKELNCTFITIPQVKETFEVILSKPFQMWGAEMGVNEHGLTIGNEAVFTKLKFAKKNDGLTGMDMLRIALERCKSADLALEMITELLTEYGQDACGGYQDENFFYHNSFIIADASVAWVLETAGKHWIAQKVRDFRSISNGLTIEEDYDLISPNAIHFANQQGWIKKGKDFNFKKAYSDFFYTKFSNCKIRQGRSMKSGNDSKGNFGKKEAIKILTSHNRSTEKFKPSHCSSASICMHPTGIANPSQTTGSMVAEIRKNKPPTIWLTGTSMPCLSIFKPFFFGGNALSEDRWKQPSQKLDDSLWWQAERVNRYILKDYHRGIEVIKAEQAHWQKEWLEIEKNAFAKDRLVGELDLLSKTAVAKHFESLKKWDQELSNLRLRQKSLNPFYRRYWKNVNKQSGVI